MGPGLGGRGGAWAIEQRRGDAAELHALDDLGGGRRVLVCDVTRSAWVLGSTQPDTAVEDDLAAGERVQVVRRRSGGGAVLLVPGDHVWVDVVVPSADLLAEDDVERATWWLGETWARALDGLGVPSPAVHRRGVTDRELGRAVCFAALGPGEVTAEHRKVVGMSQRRTRDWTRLQCVLHLRFEASRTATLAAPGVPSASRTRLGTVLRDRVGALERWSAASGADVVDAFAAELERAGTD